MFRKRLSPMSFMPMSVEVCEDCLTYRQGGTHRPKDDITTKDDNHFVLFL